MKIYGAPASRATRVTWALEEANASYEYIKISLREGEGRKEPYLSLNPGGKVPTLVDGDLVLTESAAICLHIADKYPEAKLIGALGSSMRAEVYKWSIFAASELEQPLWTIAKHQFALPEDKRMPAINPTATWEFARAATVLSKGLGNSNFLVNDQFTVADIMVGHTLMWAKKFNIPFEEENLQRYLGRMFTRPALSVAFEKETNA